MSRSDEAAEVAARLTGAPVSSVQPLGGAAYRVRMGSGEQLVVKSHNDPNAVRAEVASLRWLAEPDEVPVPRVHAGDKRWLITGYVAPGTADPQAAEHLGRGLAHLHAAGAPAFGSPPPGGPVDAAIGLAPMSNVESVSWAEFYGRQRVEPYVATAVSRGIFSRDDARFFTRVLDRLQELAGPPEVPSRLHGDLWSGNVVWGADGRAWLIDPASHGGHRETDLAMLELFGCPHLDRLLDAYEDEKPLAEGWRERTALHQLFPLLVHTVLFGGGYARQAVEAARRSLAA